jgi:LmbE family N-acetylglucosaminyl deacetylase
MKKILVVGAHFDDAELGAGGSMAKWIGEGKEVFKLTLTNNITSFTNNTATIGYHESQRDSTEACKILGVKEVLHLTAGECTELSYNKRQMQEIEKFILDNEIDTLVTHYLHDIQQDHVHASTISYVAARYCDTILMYQSNKYILPHAFYPRIFVDITNTIDLKKQALACYSDGHNRFGNLFDLTIESNKINGFIAQKSNTHTYAEAFDLIKMIM